MDSAATFFGKLDRKVLLVLLLLSAAYVAIWLFYAGLTYYFTFLIYALLGIQLYRNEKKIWDAAKGFTSYSF